MTRGSTAAIIMVLVAIAGVAVYLGRTPPVNAPKDKPEAEKAAVDLAALSDKDIERIDPGLGCTFSHGDKAYFLSNTGQALIKVGGMSQLAAIDEATASELIDGGGTVDVAGHEVTIATDGRIVRRFDEGQALGATLTVVVNGRAKSMTGEWACGA